MTNHAWLASLPFAIDRSLRRPAPGLVVGGSPVRVLRLTPAGDELLDEIAAGGHLRQVTPARAMLMRRIIGGGLVHPVPGPLEVGGTMASVVVPARNHAAHVAQAVRAGARIGQVVVVDDASGDSTAREAEGAGARVTRLPTHRGPSAARNAGARSAESEVLFFLDADCVPEPGCLETLLAHFADPKVGAVAPRIVGHEREATGALGRYEQSRSPIDMGPRSGPVRPDAAVSFVPTATIAVRRSAFEEVGGFDEELHFGEDVDFVWRLGAAGWDVRYDSRVIARHHHRRRPTDVARRRWLYGTSSGPLAHRHPGAMAAVRGSPWTLGAWLALLAGAPVPAAVLVAWSWVGLARALRHLPGAGRVAARLVLGGTVGLTRPLASALTRSWGPLTLAVGMARPRVGRRLLLLMAAGKALEWVERRPPLDPATFGVLGILDDLVFCGGVWEGCFRCRVATPLLPRAGRPRIGDQKDGHAV